MECWVPGCVARGEALKDHAFREHIPGVFSESLDLSQQDVLAGREQGLLMAATFLQARPSTLEELRADLDVLCMLGSADNRLITDDQQQAMAAFAQHLSGSVVPDTTFQLHPFSEVAAMIHWRVLMLIAARMNERQRAHWKEVYGHGGHEELVQDKPSVGPKAFDAHFHLDRTTALAGLPRSSSLE
ncbi:hypothetical protein ACOMHN_017459 [Nucella lapillus]